VKPLAKGGGAKGEVMLVMLVDVELVGKGVTGVVVLVDVVLVGTGVTGLVMLVDVVLVGKGVTGVVMLVDVELVGKGATGALVVAGEGATGCCGKAPKFMKLVNLGPEGATAGKLLKLKKKSPAGLSGAGAGVIGVSDVELVGGAGTGVLVVLDVELVGGVGTGVLVVLDVELVGEGATGVLVLVGDGATGGWGKTLKFMKLVNLGPEAAVVVDRLKGVINADRSCNRREPLRPVVLPFLLPKLKRIVATKAVATRILIHADTFVIFGTVLRNGLCLRKGLCLPRIIREDVVLPSEFFMNLTPFIAHLPT
jgi:hypothetical protein